MKSSVSIVGAGSWGTALAIHMASSGQVVRLWVYEEEICREIREKRENGTFLQDFRIPENVIPSCSMEESLDGSNLVIFVVPTEFARGVFGKMKSVLKRRIDLLIATKGIESDSLKLMSELALDVLGEGYINKIGIISGPSFAAEMARGDPTAVVISSGDAGFAEQVQKEISHGNFRLYTNSDTTGVQVAGSLKNVVAIAAGIIDGLGFGNNTLAALITRGMSEIRRLGTRMGGYARTFSGLAGVGDLVLTCTGRLSRNRTVGMRLGKGERLQEILAGMKMIAEGVTTCISTRRLAKIFDVEMPIASQVHSVLYEDKKPAEAIGELLSRPLKEED
ncbi:MAG: NAD(P)H-dependent glycerol-3-phosphate dehydrogenase [Acidobacteriota bacterium]